MRILLACLALSPLLVTAEIYRTVDKDGNVIFSDEAGADAEEIHVKEPMTFSSEDYVDPYRQGQAQAGEKEPEKFRYARLEIASPPDETTIRDSSGALTLNLVIEPAVPEHHSGQLLMNGSVHSKLSGTTSISMPHVDRGAHQFQIRIVDAKSGRTVQTGKAITVYMHRNVAR